MLWEQGLYGTILGLVGWLIIGMTSVGGSPFAGLPVAAWVVGILTSVIIILLVAFLIYLIVKQRRAQRSQKSLSAGNADSFPQYRVFGDRPYTWSNEPIGADDPLEVNEFVKIIGNQILRASETSFAVAIDAEWGMGKTSAMLLLRQWLDNEGCLTFWFNAWKYRHEDVRRGFMNTIIAGIPTETWTHYLPQSRNKRLQLIKETGNLIGRATHTGQLGTLIAHALSDESVYRDQLEDEFHEIIATWAQQADDKRPLVAVFVDDLDRCMASEITRVLETMKLFFDTDGCIFIFGYDALMIASSIQKEYEGIVKDGLTYLKKLVQITYQLPTPNDRTLYKYVDKCIEQRLLEPFFLNLNPSVDHRKLILEGTSRNLRDIKRFLDALVLSSNVVRTQLREDEGAGKSYFALCLLVMLQIRWPRSYKDLVKATQEHLLVEFLRDIYGYLDQIRERRDSSASSPVSDANVDAPPQTASRRNPVLLLGRMPWLDDEGLRRFLEEWRLNELENVIRGLVLTGLPTVAETFTAEDLPENVEGLPLRIERPVDARVLGIDARQFVGRTSDLAWLVENLESVESSGVVALAGMGGIGKTTLAYMAANRLSGKGRFKDGIVWVVCAGKNDAAEVLRSALSRFDAQNVIPDTADLDMLASIAPRLLRGKDVLVILDNIEPELRIDDVIGPLRAGGAVLLLTSRQVLPMLNGSRLDVGLLEHAEALALFTQQLGKTAESLTREDLGAAERIVEILGRHTLAVKLAGAYAAAIKRPLDALATELDRDPLSLSMDGSLAVAAVFRRSIELLPENARTLFAGLSAFASREFGRQAATALANGLSLGQAGRLIDLLIQRALVDTNTMTAMPPEGDKERLSLHQLLRELSMTLFSEWHEEQQNVARLAVAQFYAEYCPKATPGALDVDQQNIMPALRWVQARGPDNLLVGMCLGLGQYWNTRGNTREALTTLPLAIEVAKRIANESGLSEDQLHAADLALEYAQELRRSGQMPEAQHTLQENLEVRKAIGDRSGEGKVLAQLGQVARMRGRMEDAESYFGQSLSICREVKDRVSEAYDLSQLGQIAKTRGDLQEAERYFTSSLQIRREIGNRLGEADDLGYLGQLARLRGQLELAEGYFRQSLAIAERANYPRAQATALSELGQLARARSKLDEAVGFLERSLEIRRRTLDTRREGLDLGLLGRVAQAKGQLDKAEEYFQQSLELARRVEDKRGEAAVLGSLAQLDLARGNLAKAESLLNDSLRLYREAQDRQGESVALSQLGRVHLDRGDYEIAERNFRACLEIERAMQDRPGEAVDLSQLGLATLEAGRLDEAEQLLKQSLEIRSQVHDPRGEGVDRALLGRIAFERGRTQEAEALYRESLDLAKQAKNRRGEGVDIRYLGLIAETRGEIERAEEMLRESLLIGEEVQNGLDIADTQVELGRFSIAYHDERDKGCHYFTEAVARYKQIGARVAEDRARQKARQLNCDI